MKKIIVAIATILLLVSIACVGVVMPGKSTQDTQKTPNQHPIAYIDSVKPTPAYLGDSVTFTGHGIDTDGAIIGYEWRSSLAGALSTVASFTTTSLPIGTHIIYFRVIDNGSLWSVEASTTITVSTKVAKPVIESFAATPSSIVRGGSSELRWSVSGAKTVAIDNGIGQVAAVGSRMLYPAANTTYILAASNDGGSVTATASVTVQESAVVGNPVINFTANHLGGTSWRLNWNVLHSTQVVIEPDIGKVDPTGSTIVTVPSGQSKTYRLTATNNWGWAYWQVMVVSP